MLLITFSLHLVTNKGSIKFNLELVLQFTHLFVNIPVQCLLDKLSFFNTNARMLSRRIVDQEVPHD